MPLCEGLGTLTHVELVVRLAIANAIWQSFGSGGDRFFIRFKKILKFIKICSHRYRTDTAFQQGLKRGVTFISTDYIIPSEICCMLNVILDAKNQSFKLCTIDGVDMVRTGEIRQFKSLCHQPKARAATREPCITLFPSN